MCNDVYPVISLHYFYWSAPLFDFEQKYCFSSLDAEDEENKIDYQWTEQIFTHNQTHCADIADGWEWVQLLCRRPQLASWCDWKIFTGCHWDLLNVCTKRVLNHYQTSEDLTNEIGI